MRLVDILMYSFVVGEICVGLSLFLIWINTVKEKHRLKKINQMFEKTLDK